MNHSGETDRRYHINLSIIFFPFFGGGGVGVGGVAGWEGVVVTPLDTMDNSDTVFEMHKIPYEKSRLSRFILLNQFKKKKN